MSTWNTGHFVQPIQRQVARLEPTPEQLEMINLKYLDKMNILWIEYYQEYARLFNSDIQKFVFPTQDEILEQFANTLKSRRPPDYPKPAMEKANMTYGDYRRMRDPGGFESGSYNAFNDFQSKRPRSDNGWDEGSSTPAYSTNSINKENNSGWKDRKESWGSENRGRGRGRGRGGSFRGSRNNNRFDGRSNDRSSDSGWGGKKSNVASGWSDDEDSGSNQNNQKCVDDNSQFQNSQNPPIQSTASEWDEDPPQQQVAVQKTKNIPNENNADEWDDNPQIASSSLTQDSQALKIDTQYMSETQKVTQVKADDNDDWD